MSTQAITSYVRAKMPNHMFNTVSIYCNTGTDPHKDNRNAPVPNGIVALSDFKGGEVWIESEDGESIQVVGGKQMRGNLHMNDQNGVKEIFTPSTSSSVGWLDL